MRKVFAEARGRVEPVFDAAVTGVVEFVGLIGSRSSDEVEPIRSRPIECARGSRRLTRLWWRRRSLSVGDLHLERHVAAPPIRPAPSCCSSRRLVDGLVPFGVQIEAIGAVDAARWRECGRADVSPSCAVEDRSDDDSGAINGRCTAWTASIDASTA